MGKKPKKPTSQEAALPTGPWRVHFFQRHNDDDPSQSVPVREYLDACPVAARLLAVVKAVADAPPPAFSGGGKWEAMHGEMAGFFEVRADGPRRRHYRLFCMLERDGARCGLDGPSLVLIAGMDKPLGDEHKRRKPRSVAE